METIVKTLKEKREAILAVLLVIAVIAAGVQTNNSKRKSEEIAAAQALADNIQQYSADAIAALENKLAQSQTSVQELSSQAKADRAEIAAVREELEKINGERKNSLDENAR